MAIGYLSPLWGAGAQLLNLQGVILAGGFINTFLAGTTTPQTTYTSSTLSTPNGVSIQLSSAGTPPQEIWIPAGTPLKFQLTDSTGAQVGNVFDNITGVNDPGVGATGVSVWSAVTGTPSYISSTQFSQPGNLTSVYPVGTRVQYTVTAGTAYGTVSASSFSTFTTVTIIPDGTVLDNGLSAVAVSINAVAGRNVSSAAVDYKSSITYPSGSVGAAIQGLGQGTTTAGTSTAFTVAPAIPATSYVANQSYLVTFNQASGANPTLNISALGPKNLLQYNSAGTLVPAVVFANQSSYVIYNGTSLVVLEPIPTGGTLLRITPFTASGTWTIGTGTGYIVVKAQGAGGGSYNGGTGGGGGGGGGYSETLITAPPGTAAVVVGTGGASGSPGGAGGATTWASTVVIANGGAAGAATGGGAGGSSIGAVGNVVIPGQGGGYGGAWSADIFFGQGGGAGGGAGDVNRSVGISGAVNSGGGGSGGSSSGGTGAAGYLYVYEYSA
jgi:hypothetical protein